MIITIDKGSGFCFGVVSAIGVAEAELDAGRSLYCLGDIVHNNMELERLRKKGLQFIDHSTFKTLHSTTVFIRAHGEPPSTYQTALENDITLIDASCPVVLKLQASIRKACEKNISTNGQLVIFGKKGHAEVVGLLGQTLGTAIVVSSESDLDEIDYTFPVVLFAQTTQNKEAFQSLAENIRNRFVFAGKNPDIFLDVRNTICRLVANRAEELSGFAKLHDIVLFVSDPKSSNGKYLYSICKQANSNSHFICSTQDIDFNWFKKAKHVGVCGATSTPYWLMQEIADFLKSKKN